MRLSPDDEILAAATARAEALARHDARALRRWLHPRFGWTSHLGATFDRETYIEANTRGGTDWADQRLEDVDVTVVGDTAVLRCVAVDTIDTGDGHQVHRMPMTQTWVRSRIGWVCLAGHAGPRQS